MATAASDFQRVQFVVGPHDQEAYVANMKHCFGGNFRCAKHLVPSDACRTCTPEEPSLRLPWYSMCLTACPVPSIMKHIGCAAISTGKDSTVPLSSVLLPDILTSWYNKYFPGGTVTCREQCSQLLAEQACTQALHEGLGSLDFDSLCHHALPSSVALC